MSDEPTNEEWCKGICNAFGIDLEELKTRKPNEQASIVTVWDPIGTWKPRRSFVPPGEVGYAGAALYIGPEVYTVPWIVEQHVTVPFGGQVTEFDKGTGKFVLPSGSIGVLLGDCGPPTFQYNGSLPCNLQVDGGLIYTNMPLIWTKYGG